MLNFAGILKFKFVFSDAMLKAEFTILSYRGAAPSLYPSTSLR
jgi:hypothetical protein